jgi:hypothetical protein
MFRSFFFLEPDKQMKCAECKRKIPLVDEQLCHCQGCLEKFCIAHRGNHFVACPKFDELKKNQEKLLLSKKMSEEATKPKQVDVI